MWRGPQYALFVAIEFGAPKDLLDYADKDAELPWLEAAKGRRGRIIQRMLGDDSATWPSQSLAANRPEASLSLASRWPSGR